MIVLPACARNAAVPVLARSECVDRIAREWGREAATPDEARQILKLGRYAG